MTEKQRPALMPYLVLSFGLAYTGHWLTKYVLEFWSLAPAGDPMTDLFGLSKLNWLSEHLGDKSLLDLSPTLYSLLAAALVFFIPILVWLSKDKSGTYRHGEEHGSARFATISELMPFRDEVPENNMIFTKNGQMGLFNKRLPYARQLNKNTLVVGLPGDGKTYTYVKPNLMQCNSSFVVTDPKGLLVYEVGSMLEKEGYQIKVFDLVHLTNSNQFNVFKYMRSELDIDRIAEAIVEGTKKSDNQGEDFWMQAELMLMRALLGYLYFDGQLSGYTPNLAMVADLLRNLQREDENVASPVETMFNELEKASPDNYACKQWQLFNANFKSETRTSVLAMLSARYSVFDHDVVKQLIERDTMDIETWNTQKTAVFIAIPETNKAFNFIASLMFAMMFEICTHNADSILQGRHPKFKAADLLHIQFIIDEFANIGKIPNFNEVLASVRSREMSIKIIIQAINQLETIYSKAWKTLSNNCAVHLFLGTNDDDTMKYYSTRAGKQTINDRDYSVNKGRQGSTTESNRKLARDLLTPDEVARIGVDEALLFIAKQNVLKDKKATVADHPRAQLLSNGPDDENWYIYKRYMTELEEYKANVREENIHIVTEEDLAQVDLSLPWNAA